MRFLLACALLLAPHAADAQTVRHYLTIVIDYPDSIPTNAEMMGWIRDVVAVVDQDNTDQSYGMEPQVTDVAGPFMVDPTAIIAANGFTAGSNEIAKAAQSAATANGIDLSPYLSGSNFIYLFPQPSTFGANYSIGGLGNANGVWVGGAFSRAWVPGRGTLTHEEGHHTGTFWEQTGLDCSDQSPIGGAKGVTCPELRYGDSLDVMGSGPGQFNAIEKCRRGWLPCPAPVGFGDYFIAPLESDTGNRSLVIDVAKQGSKGQYLITLEYRQPIGVDAALSNNLLNIFGGVVAHNGWQPTRLLRLHPDTTSFSSRKFNSPALLVGETVCFSLARVSIATLSADANGAWVRIDRCQR